MRKLLSFARMPLKDLASGECCEQSSVSGKARVVVDCNLPIERPVIEPLQFEMIHRINLVAEIFQGTDQRLRHVLPIYLKRLELSEAIERLEHLLAAASYQEEAPTRIFDSRSWTQGAKGF
jgi:hypothetical protein